MRCFLKMQKESSSSITFVWKQRTRSKERFRLPRNRTNGPLIPLDTETYCLLSAANLIHFPYAGIYDWSSHLKSKLLAHAHSLLGALYSFPSPIIWEFLLALSLQRQPYQCRLCNNLVLWWPWVAHIMEVRVSGKRRSLLTESRGQQTDLKHSRANHC